MPTSAPGSRRRRLSALRPGRAARDGGFTLIELLVVIAIIALAAGIVSLALPDSAASRLEHEAARLSVLLEGARGESRASGASVQWVPGAQGNEDAAGFRFVGLPAALKLPERWLDSRVSAQVVGSNVVVLGPDAILPAQRIVLRLDDRRLELATDGLGPFTVAPPATEGAP